MPRRRSRIGCGVLEEPLQGLARMRIVQCGVDAGVALDRKLRRMRDDPLRRAHEEPRPADAVANALVHHAFDRVSVDAPSIAVDTTGGYAPGFEAIVAFVNGAS